MTFRSDIIEAIRSHIASETGYVGYRGMKFLDQINEFPAFYVHVKTENRTHIGQANKLAIIEMDIRAYEYSDSLDAIEDVVRSVELAIESFSLDGVDEARITHVSTDEGLLLPYAVGDMSLEVLYRIIQQ